MTGDPGSRRRPGGARDRCPGTRRRRGPLRDRRPDRRPDRRGRACRRSGRLVPGRRVRRGRRAPLQVEVGGEPYVAFRPSPDAAVSVLPARCPHRLVRLDHGSLVGAGCAARTTAGSSARRRLRADPVGGPDAAVPPRAHLAAPWGVREEDGQVWVAPVEPGSGDTGTGDVRATTEGSATWTRRCGHAWHPSPSGPGWTAAWTRPALQDGPDGEWSRAARRPAARPAVDPDPGRRGPGGRRPGPTAARPRPGCGRPTGWSGWRRRPRGTSCSRRRTTPTRGSPGLAGAGPDDVLRRGAGGQLPGRRALPVRARRHLRRGRGAVRAAVRGDRGRRRLQLVQEQWFDNPEDPGVAAGLRPVRQRRRATYRYAPPFQLLAAAGGAGRRRGRRRSCSSCSPEDAGSTRIYTKMLLHDIGGVALPWPEVVAPRWPSRSRCWARTWCCSGR